MGRWVAGVITRATRLPVALWVALMVAGWLAYALLMYLGNTAFSVSFVETLVPGIFNIPAALIPGAWLTAPVESPGPRQAGALLHWLVMALIWLAYGLGALALRRQAGRVVGRRTLAAIVAVGLLLGLTTILWRTLQTTDMYSYAVQAEVGLAGFNPLVDPPKVLGADPLLGLTTWVDIPSIYGPLWLGVSAALAALVKLLAGGPALYVLFYKLLNMALLALCACLVWAIGGQLGWDGPRRAAATALFAWCPLLILELAGNGHNDGLLLLGLLLAIWLHLRRLWPLAIMALVLCGLVKITGLMFIPPYLVLLLRGSRDRVEALGRLIAGGLITVGTLVLGYAPLSHPDLIYWLLHNPVAGNTGNSLATLLRQALLDLALNLRGSLLPAKLRGADIDAALKAPIWYSLLALWAVIALLIILRVRDFAGLLRGWGLLLLTYFLIGAAWFWPWYVCWLLPLLVLLPDSRLRRAGFWLAFGGTMFYGAIPMLPYVPRWASYLAPSSIFLPIWLFLAWQVLRRTPANKYRVTSTD